MLAYACLRLRKLAWGVGVREGSMSVRVGRTLTQRRRAAGPKPEIEAREIRETLEQETGKLMTGRWKEQDGHEKARKGTKSSRGNWCTACHSTNGAESRGCHRNTGCPCGQRSEFARGFNRQHFAGVFVWQERQARREFFIGRQTDVYAGMTMSRFSDRPLRFP